MTEKTASVGSSFQVIILSFAAQKNDMFGFAKRDS